MKVLTIEEAAWKLKRTPRSIRALILRRAIPYRKVAGRIVLIEEELDQWILSSPGRTVTEIEEEE
jgi:excisionase family DNA binding protein